MSGYYRKFCRNFSVVAEPLIRLLRKLEEFRLYQGAYDKIKSVLRVPDFCRPFKLIVDASDAGGGAVLIQEEEEGIDHPVCHFSYKFNGHQRN